MPALISAWVPREWDADSYEALALPQDRWGLRVLSLLNLKGGDRVLEAGCGTGRDTARLLKRLPHGSVVALDASAQMLEKLRARLSGQLDRVQVVRADLARTLPLAEAVDAVFSVATFHWLADHAALFRNLAAALKPGGQLVADCGGRGNIASVRAAIREVSGRSAEGGIWNFAGPEETRSRLQDAGFCQVEVGLHPEPVRFDTREALERYLSTVVLGSHLERLAAEDQPSFVRAIAALVPEREIDYVRLTISAVRAPSGESVQA